MEKLFNAPPENDQRFTDSTVAQIVEGWRGRNDMVRAMTRLTNQVHAITKRACEGDETQSRKLFAALSAEFKKPGSAKKPHELTDALLPVVSPIFEARLPLEAYRTAQEKALAKLADTLPVAPFLGQVRGFSSAGLAGVVGECGDLSAYPCKQYMWKRAGLAVIGGERQRLVAGDAAKIHGYNPSRRSVMWVFGDSMMRSQGKGETALYYRQMYDMRKAYELTKVETLGHAHLRANRYVFKALLKDMRNAWMAVNRGEDIRPLPERYAAPENTQKAWDDAQAIAAQIAADAIDSEVLEAA